MSVILGIDTSNYTTSCALLDSDSMEVLQRKQLLPVKKGDAGLRQSDAVFHHTKQLPTLLEELMTAWQGDKPQIVVASMVPTNADGSYMPCFLVGEGCARSIATVSGIDIYTTSHQTGHILAALYSANKLELIHGDKPFLAFHVSGGTTDLLLCKPDDNCVIRVTEVARSLDLKAGQAVDRVGLLLGLDFPCGKELEILATRADRHFKCKPVLKDGNCCLSGLENKCTQMYADGESRENVAAFCLDFIAQTVEEMTEQALEKYGDMQIVYAGGVMSDKLIRNRLESRFNAYFAAPEFSCDNAVGVSVYGAITKGMI